ncbi:MAG TPA: TrmH family RNA methyltransferase, partial [Bacteroidales bacterium]
STPLEKFHAHSTKKYPIVFGNEVKGVDQEIVDISDKCIELAQYGTKHSINVSVIAGIVIWELFKQLKLER